MQLSRENIAVKQSRLLDGYLVPCNMGNNDWDL